MPTQKDINNAETVRNMTAQELDGLTKTELRTALQTMVVDNLDLGRKVDAIRADVTFLMTERQHMKDDIDGLKERCVQTEKQIQSLQQTNDQLSEGLMHHQRYLEMVDSEKRNGNVIITGITEADLVVDDKTIEDDHAKVGHIFEKIKLANVLIDEVQRLGKNPPTDPARPRAMKVKLKNITDRDSLLENAKALKNAGDQYKRIYIKKDVHPSTRKEFQRLKGVEQRERDRPENAGKQVKLDYSTRKVYVNDIVVDSFKPYLF